MHTEVNPAHIPQVAEVLTSDQLTLLVTLLQQIIISGYGELAIVIKDGKIRFFRVTFSIPAPPPVNHE